MSRVLGPSGVLGLQNAEELRGSVKSLRSVTAPVERHAQGWYKNATRDRSIRHVIIHAIALTEMLIAETGQEKGNASEIHDIWQLIAGKAVTYAEKLKEVNSTISLWFFLWIPFFFTLLVFIYVFFTALFLGMIVFVREARFYAAVQPDTQSQMLKFLSQGQQEYGTRCRINWPPWKVFYNSRRV